jgi:class 3 adenylate cyclase
MGHPWAEIPEIAAMTPVVELIAARKCYGAIEARRAFLAGMRAASSAGKTIVLTTHYLEEADALAERIVVIDRGVVIADAPPRDLKAEDECTMERRLAAIFSTDVQGYSRLMGDDEMATIHTLTAYRDLMATLIQQHRGRVVDSPGDNLLAEFASVVEAVQCAVALTQRQ